MEVVKKTKEFTIVKKRSGRFGVLKLDKKWINGDEKIKILVKEGLVKTAIPKPKVVEEPKAEATEEPKEEKAEEKKEA